MTLATGTRLGPYEILAPLGAGGMGEVYKARDTRLERTVAIKVLPQHLSSSPEIRQRFEREAKTISQLSHPHICALHDVGREGDVDFLVMEYLEGETLAARLTKGALPLEQTLRFGVEIADALDKAHRQGVVHRDLKPGNVMLTKSGVKLLDFGLAKLQEAGATSPFSPLSALPTQEKALTAEGTILGTLQYMAPEQLEGKETDARTDIFALGAVLYEMATGNKAFSGTSQASLISAIMQNDPPTISSLQPMTPPALDRVVQKCLSKDPEDRWHSAADFGSELKWIAAGSQVGAQAIRPSPRGRGERLGWLVAAALALLIIALWSGVLTRRTPASAVIRASILLPDGAEFVSTWVDAGPVEISPDGTRLVFTARQGEGPNLLWVRTLSESAARPLAGTEGAQRPFWSPDGRFIGFFADRAFKKIDVNGGPVFSLAPGTESRGGTWNRDGVILFTPNARGPVERVSADGGKVTLATVYGPKDATHRYASFLPDGRHFLYLVRHSGAGSGAEPEIRVGSLDSKESKRILSVASNVVYASGHILYLREGALVAQAFDLDGLAVRGEPITLASDVLWDERFSRGVFSASQNGVLVYQTGKGLTLSALRWLDRSGGVLGTVGEPAQFFNGGDPEISPDTTRATASIVDLRTGVADIWTIDLASGTRSRFTTGAGDKFWSAWSRDGSRIAYNISSPGGRGGYDILYKLTAGSGAEEKLASEPAEFEVPLSLSPDGRFLLYQRRKEERDDLWLLPLTGDRTPRPFVVTPALEQMGQFSPDGRYVAYMSDESGRFEVYVAAFPGPGGRWQVSQGGGSEPRWSRDGKELFFFAPDNRLMAAQVKSDGASFEVGAIVPLFHARAMGFSYRYDVGKDGKRFLVASGLPQELSPITLVTNWTAELEKKK
jgi:Tol biopolymer transport system component/predicted Ser/Thr protein kinase